MNLQLPGKIEFKSYSLSQIENVTQETINRFLQQNSCATLCCINEQGKPCCFSCFYAFNTEAGLLYFKSSANSNHAGLMKKYPFIAGTVLPDKLNKLFVQGIQFEGEVLNTQQPIIKKGLGYYLKKHPLALAMPGEIWAIQINHIKMTDSIMGFGKKILWNRSDMEG